MQTAEWNVVDAEELVLWREYMFTKGAYATTMVFRGVDGLVVVSPGTGMGERDFDALREHGEVRALVANNAIHHLGQTVWRERFPEAASYAPDAAVDALRKKVPGVQFRGLSELALPDHVRYAEPPGFKSPQAFFSVHSGKGAIWYTGDLLTNIQRTPGPPVRWLFTWSGSAPGYRLFKPAVWFFVRDRRSLRSWMLDQLDSDPPAVIIPAHGPAFASPDLVALTKAQLRRM